METLHWIIISAAAVLNIWLICLFVSMASNVRRIKDKLAGSTDYVRKELYLDILLGKEHEAYGNIVAHLYDTLYYLATCKQEDEMYLEEIAKNGIATAVSMCKRLGKELPNQLRSLEAFKEFINIQ